MTRSTARGRLARILPAAAMATLLAACADAPTGPTVPVPDALRAPPGERLLRTLDGEGVQIYQCQAKASDAGAAEWALVAPEARLLDGRGAQVGRHFAGPSWEAADGSRVVGTVRARMDAPDGAIPWLLLAVHSTGPDGAFAHVTSVQRLATAGGAAPAAGCSPAAVGQQVRVPYKAQYVFYTRGG